jgi:hypothetical protein
MVNGMESGVGLAQRPFFFQPSVEINGDVVLNKWQKVKKLCDERQA